MRSKSVILKKIDGYYQVFGDGALIINYLFDYEVEDYECNFPLNDFDRVVSVLNRKNINYVIKAEKIKKKNFKENKYEEYLDKYLTREIFNEKSEKITKQLDDSDRERLIALINLMDDENYNHDEF